MVMFYLYISSFERLDNFLRSINAIVQCFFKSGSSFKSYLLG